MTCTKPGCGGAIQDGYCDTCGMAPAPVASGSVPSGPSAPSGPSGAWFGASGPVSAGGSSRFQPRGSKRTSGRSARGRLGAGLVEIPPVPYRDPASAVQPAGSGPILGCEPNPRALRFGLERTYRALARLTPDESRRIELVDMANAIRPRTLT